MTQINGTFRLLYSISSDAHAQKFSGATCLILGINLHQGLLYNRANSEGSGVIAQLRLSLRFLHMRQVSLYHGMTYLCCYKGVVEQQIK